MKSILILLLFSLTLSSEQASKVIQFAKSKLGCGYVWGTSGMTLTKQNIKKFQGNSHVDVNIVKKWIGKQVFDCAGLVLAAFKTVGIRMASGATSAWGHTSWAKKGEIKNYPKDQVCILYRRANGRMQHTGIYIGNGEYIHAKGSRDGVVKEKMPGHWTHWGIPNGFDAKISGTTSHSDKNDERKEEQKDKSKTSGKICSSFPCKAKVVANSGGTVNLRKGPNKGSKVLTKIKLGETVQVSSEENSWCQIQYGGKTGFMMREFLEKV